jgi:hypothetical protein
MYDADLADTENYNLPKLRRRLPRIAALAPFLPSYAQRLDSLTFSTVNCGMRDEIDAERDRHEAQKIAERDVLSLGGHFVVDFLVAVASAMTRPKRDRADERA